MAQVTFLSMQLPRAVTIRIPGRNRRTLLALARCFGVPLRCQRGRPACGRCAACAVKVATIHAARRATRLPGAQERQALSRAGKSPTRRGPRRPASHGPFWRLASRYVPGEDVWVAF
ncbi:MAG: hypothetical protein M0Z76_02055 [Gammaproteobacteria bacterium]|nr:hypothetical protein [Gammaproteobacteria bacterium]